MALVGVGDRVRAACLEVAVGLIEQDGRVVAAVFSRLSIVVGETRDDGEAMQDVAGYWDVDFYDFVSGSPGVVEGLAVSGTWTG